MWDAVTAGAVLAMISAVAFVFAVVIGAVG
jgi:hypothetical protein